MENNSGIFSLIKQRTEMGNWINAPVYNHPKLGASFETPRVIERALKRKASEASAQKTPEKSMMTLPPAEAAAPVLQGYQPYNGMRQLAGSQLSLQTTSSKRTYTYN